MYTTISGLMVVATMSMIRLPDGGLRNAATPEPPPLSKPKAAPAPPVAKAESVAKAASALAVALAGLDGPPPVMVKPKRAPALAPMYQAIPGVSRPQAVPAQAPWMARAGIDEPAARPKAAPAAAPSSPPTVTYRTELMPGRAGGLGETEFVPVGPPSTNSSGRSGSGFLGALEDIGSGLKSFGVGASQVITGPLQTGKSLGESFMHTLESVPNLVVAAGSPTGAPLSRLPSSKDLAQTGQGWNKLGSQLLGSVKAMDPVLDVVQIAAARTPAQRAAAEQQFGSAMGQLALMFVPGAGEDGAVADAVDSPVVTGKVIGRDAPVNPGALPRPPRPVLIAFKGTDGVLRVPGDEVELPPGESAPTTTPGGLVRRPGGARLSRRGPTPDWSPGRTDSTGPGAAFFRPKGITPEQLEPIKQAALSPFDLAQPPVGGEEAGPPYSLSAAYTPQGGRPLTPKQVEQLGRWLSQQAGNIQPATVTANPFTQSQMNAINQALANWAAPGGAGGSLPAAITANPFTQPQMNAISQALANLSAPGGAGGSQPATAVASQITPEQKAWISKVARALEPWPSMVAIVGSLVGVAYGVEEGAIRGTLGFLLNNARPFSRMRTGLSEAMSMQLRTRLAQAIETAAGGDGAGAQKMITDLVFGHSGRLGLSPNAFTGEGQQFLDLLGAIASFKQTLDAATDPATIATVEQDIKAAISQAKSLKLKSNFATTPVGGAMRRGSLAFNTLASATAFYEMTNWTGWVKGLSGAFSASIQGNYIRSMYSYRRALDAAAADSSLPAPKWNDFMKYPSQLNNFGYVTGAGTDVAMAAYSALNRDIPGAIGYFGQALGESGLYAGSYSPKAMRFTKYYIGAMMAGALTLFTEAVVHNFFSGTGRPQQPRGSHKPAAKTPPAAPPAAKTPLWRIRA